MTLVSSSPTMCGYQIQVWFGDVCTFFIRTNIDIQKLTRRLQTTSAEFLVIMWMLFQVKHPSNKKLKTIRKKSLFN